MVRTYRQPSPTAKILGLRQTSGYLDRVEARRFNALLNDAIEGGQFLYSVTYFLTSATMPTDRR